MTDNPRCLVLDDALTVLPISSKTAQIEPVDTILEVIRSNFIYLHLHGRLVMLFASSEYRPQNFNNKVALQFLALVSLWHVTKLRLVPVSEWCHNITCLGLKFHCAQTDYYRTIFMTTCSVSACKSEIDGASVVFV